MTKFIMIHDLVEENGKTIKENNLERKHTIPIGSLVEVKYDEWHRGGACQKIHARLFVVRHSRDCDGTPLYMLGPNTDELELPEKYQRLVGGFAEESLTIVPITPEIIDGANALCWDEEEK